MSHLPSELGVCCTGLLRKLGSSSDAGYHSGAGKIVHESEVQGGILGSCERLQRLDVGLLRVHPGPAIFLDRGLEIEGLQIQRAILVRTSARSGFLQDGLGVVGVGRIILAVGFAR